MTYPTLPLLFCQPANYNARLLLRLIRLNPVLDLLLKLAALVYLVSTSFVLVFLAGFGVLLAIYLWTRRHAPHLPHIPDAELLPVTVQLPIYNEPAVVDRLLDACARLDYPRDRLHIQVIDDSTDGTSAIIAGRVRQMQAAGLRHIQHIHRARRDGYKAGALAHGMQFVESECVVIFDADFVPGPDFLRRTMPHFSADPRLGLLQTRWDHLNPDYNLLTRAQALSIDAHFGIEQVARSRGHLPMSMNGTGGIWRVQAIADAGGWSADTLTEDLDLSYRAFMRGWRFLYRVDVAVPGELPPLIQLYKQQQARWATGSTQCLLRHSRALLACRRCTPLDKLMGLLHLAQYAIQPVILVLFLLTPLLLAAGFFDRLPNLAAFALLGLIPPAIIALAQFELHPDWPRRLLYFPVQLAAGVAIVASNSRAVITAVLRHHEQLEFWRTPKFRLTRPAERPLAPLAAWPGIDGLTLAELALAAYALLGLFIAAGTTPALVPYMLTYALSFSLFALGNIVQARRLGVVA